MQEQFSSSFSPARIGAGILSLLALYFVSLFSYPIFHTFAEFFSIVIGFCLFLIIWNSRRIAENNYLLFIGIAYVFVAFIDLVHALAYKGINIFSGYGTNLPTQLWIAARYLQSLSLLAALLFISRKLRAYWTLAGFATLTTLVLASIFLRFFPDCYIEGEGLTRFKIVSEYLISAILICSCILLLKKRASFSREVITPIFLSIVATIGSELAFTSYVGVYDFSNLIGHFLKIIAFYLIYRAIMETGFSQPYSLLFRNLKQQEEVLRESEEQYRLLFAANPSPMFVFDAETFRFLAVNDAAVAQYGWSREEFLGMTVWGVRPAEDRQLAQDTITRHRGAHDAGIGVFRHCRKDGTVMDMEITASSISFEGRPARLWLMNDITERKLMEDALRQSRDELEIRVVERTAELNQAYEKLRQEMSDRGRMEEQLHHSQKMEAIGTLAGGIAHDFNNMLAAILGFTEMAMEDVQDHPDIQTSLQHVLKASLRARDLVKQILAFSRKAGHERNPLSLTPLIKETVQLLRASIPTAIEIKFTATATSDMVLAAPTEIQQILMNLATNASLAMQENGGTMEVSVTDIDFEPDSPVFEEDVSPGEYVQLTVKDTGIGMTPDVMKRVFEPFFTTREVGKGTGMGLAVVYGIVKDLQGTITVETELGVGSTFSVLLPKVKTDAQTEAVKAVEIPGGNERILFVDDEEMLTKWGQTTLERLGYTVTSVTDPQEALNIFSSDPSRFDLVITDHTMPGITGVQIARELLKLRPDIPIILCTGHSETVSAEIVKEAGIQEYLMKPLAKQELAEAVRGVLDTKPEN